MWDVHSKDILRAICSPDDLKPFDCLRVIAEPRGNYIAEFVSASGESELVSESSYRRTEMARALLVALRMGKFFFDTSVPTELEPSQATWKLLSQRQAIGITITPPVMKSPSDSDAVHQCAMLAIRACLTTPGNLPVAHVQQFFVFIADVSTLARDGWKARTLSDVQPPFESLGRFRKLIEDAHQPIIEEFQRQLSLLEGKAFGSFEVNKQIASLIQSTADQLRMAFLCPKPGCGLPSRLRCTKSGRSVNGFFSFEHMIKPSTRTKHGGTSTLPRLRLFPWDLGKAEE